MVKTCSYTKGSTMKNNDEHKPQTTDDNQKPFKNADAKKSDQLMFWLLIAVIICSPLLRFIH